MTAEIAQAQQEIIDEFQMFDDWMDRYEYLIDLGRQLPDFPEAWKTDDSKIQGCQSQVWFVDECRDGRLYLQGISDAAIVSGLIAVLTRVYSGRRPQEILGSNVDHFIREIGFDRHLSPTRSNGLHSMLKAIFAKAQAAL